jgi:heptosyltransferase-3
MRKILVLRGGALGDFIVTLPALALLRERWPEARIELVGNAAAALALGRGMLDAVHSQHEARWSALFGDEPLPVTFAAWIAGFDLVLNFWPDADGELRRRFRLRPGQIFLCGSPTPGRAPAAAHFCEPLREVGLSTEKTFFQLSSPRPGAHLVAVHPGSGSPRKNLPIDRWEQLCGWLEQEHHAELLIVTGDVEAAGTLGRFGTAARNLPLSELVARFADCRLFLGHDSGVGHLAAACGVPCVLLFGPTDPAIWAPPAPHVRVLRRGPEMAAISVADVKGVLPRL